MDISMGAPADYTDDATASIATRCFLKPDPLVEALCEGAGPLLGSTRLTRCWTSLPPHSSQVD
jgi:hypothetical protein